MLNRRHRFHGYGSLKRVYQHGQNVRLPLINLRYLSRPAKPYRLAVVVGRKVSKSAVKRNRIRRRLYEAVRQSQLIPDSKDIIISVFSDDFLDMPSEELKDIIRRLLSKIN